MITRCQLQNRTSKRAGYSLVEVTLALLVVAIGLTATFGLFPEGLKATRAAVNDTEAALFAEYVFTPGTDRQWKGGDYGPGNRGYDQHFQDASRHVSPSNFQLQDGGDLRISIGIRLLWIWQRDYKAEDFQAYYLVVHVHVGTQTQERGGRGGNHLCFAQGVAGGLGGSQIPSPGVLS